MTTFSWWEVRLDMAPHETAGNPHDTDVDVLDALRRFGQDTGYLRHAAVAHEDGALIVRCEVVASSPAMAVEVVSGVVNVGASARAFQAAARLSARVTAAG